MNLQGQIAIVTGAGIALDLAKQGAKVYPRTQSTIYATKSTTWTTAPHQPKSKLTSDSQTPQPNPRCHVRGLPADNKIDILVNNAGVSQCKNLVETTHEDISSVVDINVYGLMSMTRAVIPHLAPGRIINLSSVAARREASGFSVYSASKAAVEGFTRSLAYELGPAGCTVNAVEPGAVGSDMQQNTPLGGGESRCARGYCSRCDFPG
ncbi:hypothetical protein Aspvir_008088 [Aspergillus viridinutans]|uniref:Uncharacterized protein n=1 Tax=Aspergillus viridinutans TaxID=75553 RepID=A0A9P3BWX2_ASPVI|nr:uncharacterized protein Aspvir_008088 [Aspergillus viridinutans]GIK04013.1 hypothetical protein Aspvir_008088 [Aspergillus viridinutans]